MNQIVKAENRSKIKIDVIRKLMGGLDVSENTLYDYLTRIPTFMSFLRENNLDKLTLLSYKRFLASQESFSLATKNKYLVSAKILMKQLYSYGYVPYDISSTVKSFPQLKKHKVEGFSHSEMKRIVNFVKGLSDSTKNIRTKALLSLLIFQGFRQVEIVRLRVDDVDFSSGTILVQGKGNQDKELVYMHPNVKLVLKKYMRECRVRSGYLFPSPHKGKNKPISTMTIKRAIKAVTGTLRINKTVHGFRHYYITTLLNNLDVRDVRKFSRHKSLEMLIVYDDEIDVKDKCREVFGSFEGLAVV